MEIWKRLYYEAKNNINQGKFLLLYMPIMLFVLLKQEMEKFIGVFVLKVPVV